MLRGWVTPENGDLFLAKKLQVLCILTPSGPCGAITQIKVTHSWVHQNSAEISWWVKSHKINILFQVYYTHHFEHFHFTPFPSNRIGSRSWRFLLQQKVVYMSPLNRDKIEPNLGVPGIKGCHGHRHRELWNEPPFDVSGLTSEIFFMASLWISYGVHLTIEGHLSVS